MCFYNRLYHELMEYTDGLFLALILSVIVNLILIFWIARVTV